MLSNAYFLAKFRFDTAENEPAKNLQNFRKMHFQLLVRIGEVLGGPVEPHPARVLDLVERFDIEAYSDFSAK